MTQQEKCNLERFSHYITMILTPRHVLSYMATWLEEDTVERIKAEEEKGVTAAATTFLNYLLSLEKDGWFRGFLDGLNAAGYKGLCEAIENWDFYKIESLDEYRKLLRTIEPTVKNEIRPDELVTHLKDCIIHSDMEEILQLTRNKGPIAGAEKLIDCLFRSDKEEWPKTFRFALEEANYGKALELWTLESGCEEQSEKLDDNNDLDEDNSAFNMIQYSEDPHIENSSLSAGPTVSSAGAMSDSANFSGVLSDVNGVKLRSYQAELAQSALSGKNTIICAPTDMCPMQAWGNAIFLREGEGGGGEGEEEEDEEEEDEGEEDEGEEEDEGKEEEDEGEEEEEGEAEEEGQEEEEEYYE